LLLMSISSLTLQVGIDERKVEIPNSMLRNSMPGPQTLRS
jgi:hypothetical protein